MHSIIYFDMIYVECRGILSPNCHAYLWQLLLGMLVVLTVLPSYYSDFGIVNIYYSWLLLTCIAP